MSPASVWEKPFSSFRSGDTHQQAWCHVNCKHDQKPAKFCWWHWDQSQVLFCWMSLSSLPISCNWEYRGEAHLYWFLNPSSWSHDVFLWFLIVTLLPTWKIRNGWGPFQDRNLSFYSLVSGMYQTLWRSGSGLHIGPSAPFRWECKTCCAILDSLL